MSQFGSALAKIWMLYPPMFLTAEEAVKAVPVEAGVILPMPKVARPPSGPVFHTEANDWTTKDDRPTLSNLTPKSHVRVPLQ